MSISTFAEFVADALQRPAAIGTSRYLIVDAAATRPTNMATELALTRSKAVDVLSGNEYVSRETVSPVLFELSSAASHVTQCQRIAETLQKWRYANCFVYIEGPHSRDAMVGLLRQRTEAELPQGLPVLLRYFDGRVLAVVLQTLSDEQRSAFISCATRWAFPRRRGELALLDVGETHFKHVEPIKFSTEQETALIDSGEADAMVDLLLNQNNRALQALLPPDQHEQISKALAAAARFGIDQLSDQAAYCSLSLDLGPSFSEEEPWAFAMPDVRAKRLEFAEVVERVVQRGEA